MKTALILVDIQKDYFPKGRMEVAGAAEAAQMASRLLDHFRRHGLPVVHIQHIAARPGATFFLPNTEGVRFHETVQPVSGEVVIQKHFPNSFRDTGLEEQLCSNKTKDLVVCGMMSHMCIDATVRAAFDKGYACTVAHDACATRSLEHEGSTIPSAHVHGAFMSALSAVYARVMPVNDILHTLQSNGWNK